MELLTLFREETLYLYPESVKRNDKKIQIRLNTITGIKMNKSSRNIKYDCFFSLSTIRKKLLSSTISSLLQSNHTRLRSGTGETSKTANFFTHTGFSCRTSIDEDQHAKHEQQRLRFTSGVYDQSHVRGLHLR